MRPRQYLLLALVLIGAIDGLPARAGGPTDLACRKSFAVGQEWSLQSYGGTTVVIGRVEDWEEQTAIHVSILNIKGPPGSTAAVTMDQVAHAPFSCEALKRSVATLIRTDASPLSGFETGYERWQAAKGGVFTIPVTELLDVMLGAP
ncbi:MAG TPA: hypothetical protein VHA35_05275 [Dongiaceae bacterium]|jgi:hypothetical protein|nr:hypothetical protein [Dongiaceae bacterium]